MGVYYFVLVVLVLMRVCVLKEKVHAAKYIKRKQVKVVFVLRVEGDEVCVSPERL